MTRNLSIAFLLGTSLVACATNDSPSGTTPGDDQLAGETNDGEKADANALQDTFGIYTAQKVGAFECNGLGSCTHVALARANRSTTTCADGSTAATCEVRYLDFSKLSLSDAQTTDAMDKLQKSAATPEVGPQLLIRGKYIHGTNALQPGVDWVTFEVDELWVAQLADGTIDGTFVMLRDNGRRCVDAPCQSVDEAKLNSSRHMNIDGVDFPSDFSSSLRDKVDAAINVADGVILTGERTNGTFEGQFHLQTILRTPDQIYLQVK
jgi:hypothetical protein